MNEVLQINIRDDKGKVKKTAEAQLVKIKFGQVRKILDLLKIEDTEDMLEIARIINDAWDEVKAVLKKIFPDLEDEDMDEIELQELIPILVRVVKYSFAEIVTNIPHEKN